MGERTRGLLAWVGRRQRLAEAGRLLFVVFLAVAALYAALLVVSRLFAVFPHGWFDIRLPGGILSLSAAAILSLLAAAIFARRPTETDAARLVDTRMKTKDVFLSAARIDDAYGDFKPIVLRQAETAAAKIHAKEVVPLHWRRKGGMLLGAVALLAGMMLLMPQFDLLGKEEQRARQVERQKILEETRKATEERVEALKKADPSAAVSKEVATALDALKQTFNKATPKDVDANFRKLTQNQKTLSDMWKQLNENKLRDALGQAAGSQQFGAKSLDKQQAWKDQMKKGDPSGLKKELDEISTMARKLDSMEKSSDKAATEAEMKKRMEDVSDFMEKELNSRQASGAMARAMDQMSMAGVEGLSKEAMQALQESLGLSQMEIDKIAQQARDLQKIQEGLKALQLAKGLNKMEALDGAQSGGCGNMEDYEKLYKEMMAKMGGMPEDGGTGPDQGLDGQDGGGMGNHGIGRGGKAEEKDDAVTDFTPEQSRSALVAGKVLLEWKTKGVSEAGTSGVDYVKQVENVKKGVSEAILREQVPPGYHEAIQKYFDSMGGKGEGTPK